MPGETYQFGQWRIDPARNCITCGPIEQRLEPLGMEVLVHLLEHANQTVSADELLNAAWPDRVVEPNAVARVINQLRSALGDDSRRPAYIETIRKRGYRTVAPVRGPGDSEAHGPVDLESESAAETAPASSTRRRYGGVLASLLLAASGVLLAIWLSDDSAPPEPVPHVEPLSTIAVLPLRNLSPDPAEAYFSDAVTQEIWSKLTSVEGLRVISLTSAAAHADAGADLREIGRALAADYLIEGSAMRDGALVRVNIHVIDAASGLARWGTQYTETVESSRALFSLFDRMSADVGAALPERIAGLTALAEPRSDETRSIAAFNLQQRAMFEMEITGDPRRSIALVEQAITIDPTYARAHALLADLRFQMAEFGWGSAGANLHQARPAALRAIELSGGRVASAYVTLALLASRLDHDWRLAMSLLDEADERGAPPDHVAGARQDLLLTSGRYAEGLEVMREYVARNPGDGWPLLLLARFQYELGDYEAARRSFEEALVLSPDNASVLRIVIAYYVMTCGTSFCDLDRAEQILADSPIAARFNFEREQALIAFNRGDREPLERLVDARIEQAEETYARPMMMMHDLFLLGRFEEHIDWFARRVEQQETLGWLVYELREWPAYAGYWEMLDAWAREAPDESPTRHRRVHDHRRLVEDVTRKMRL